MLNQHIRASTTSSVQFLCKPYKSKFYRNLSNCKRLQGAADARRTDTQTYFLYFKCPTTKQMRCPVNAYKFFNPGNYNRSKKMGAGIKRICSCFPECCLVMTISGSPLGMILSNHLKSPADTFSLYLTSKKWSLLPSFATKSISHDLCRVLPFD